MKMRAQRGRPSGPAAVLLCPGTGFSRQKLGKHGTALLGDPGHGRPRAAKSTPEFFSSQADQRRFDAGCRALHLTSSDSLRGHHEFYCSPARPPLGQDCPCALQSSVKGLGFIAPSTGRLRGCNHPGRRMKRGPKWPVALGDGEAGAESPVAHIFSLQSRSPWRPGFMDTEGTSRGPWRSVTAPIQFQNGTSELVL